MGQKVRRRKNRIGVKGVAVRRSTNNNSVRTIEKKYGNIKVIEKEREGKNGRKRNDS